MSAWLQIWRDMPDGSDSARLDYLRSCGAALDRNDRVQLNLMWQRMQSARRARAADPATSKTAALRAAEFAGNHAGRILRALSVNGPMTAEEIGRVAGLTVVQVDRRTIELQRSGAIRTTGRTRGGMREWAA